MTIGPIENGEFINAGAYGNTTQASATEPQFRPPGLSDWARATGRGRTYNIQWRTQDYLSTVTIELHHGSAGGPLEYIIQTLAPNTGSFTSTVAERCAVTAATDYVVVVQRDDDGTQPAKAGCCWR